MGSEKIRESCQSFTIELKNNKFAKFIFANLLSNKIFFNCMVWQMISFQEKLASEIKEGNK